MTGAEMTRHWKGNRHQSNFTAFEVLIRCTHVGHFYNHYKSDGENPFGLFAMGTAPDIKRGPVSTHYHNLVTSMKFLHRSHSIVFLAFWLFAASTATLHAQPHGNWIWQNPNPTSNNLFDIQLLNSETGLIFGERNTCLRTTNGGSEWKQLHDHGIESHVRRSFFVDNKTGYALLMSVRELIMKTNDGGKTWFELSTGIPHFFQDVYFTDADNGWVVGTGATIMSTTDGGLTWNVHDHDRAITLTAIVFTDQNNGWAGGFGGTFLQTDDGGENWTPVWNPADVNFTGMISGIFFADSDHGWVYGQSGKIFQTVDGGENWTDISLGSEEFIHHMVFPDSQKGWAAADTRILHTNDGGETWSSFQAENQVRSMAFANNETGYAIGLGGLILKTTDGGANWVSQTKAVNIDVRYITFFDELNGMTVSNQGQIMRTVDGGANWIDQETFKPDYAAVLNGFKFFDASTGWASGFSGVIGKIIKTEDGGVTWIDKTDGSPNSFRDLHFTDESTGWVAGQEFSILHTSDDGNTWTLQYDGGGSSDSFNSIFFVDDQTGWVAGSGAKIMHTADGGKNWHDQNSGLTTETFIVIHFASPQKGWAVTNNGVIVHTTDGGDNWSVQNNVGISFPGEMFFLDENRGWLVGGNGAILYTADGGETWETQMTRTNASFGSIFFLNEDKGWAGGSHILAFHIADAVETSIHEEESNLPITLSLDQNYPNPFNPYTIIRYTLTRDGEVELNIFDVTGRKAASLVSGYHSAGTYEIGFDAHHLASGPYIYRLQAHGQSASRVMTLIK